jgi:DNA-directed RNA polymerase I, II, and III subunit RPABC1
MSILESQDRDISRLYRVHRTLHQMMSDRGYIVQEDHLAMSLEQFKSKYAPNGEIK